MFELLAAGDELTLAFSALLKVDQAIGTRLDGATLSRTRVRWRELFDNANALWAENPSIDLIRVTGELVKTIGSENSDDGNSEDDNGMPADKGKSVAKAQPAGKGKKEKRKAVEKKVPEPKSLDKKPRVDRSREKVFDGTAHIKWVRKVCGHLLFHANFS